MKYLKKYSKFNEESEFETQLNDPTDIRMSKEKLNILMKNITDFKSKKNQIDQIYLNEKDDSKIDQRIGDLLGPEVSNKQDRNPFLVEYLNVSNLKRKLDKLRKGILDDKVKSDDFNQELKSVKDTSQKTSVQQKITNINKRMSESNSEISKISSQISSAEKSLKDRMSKQEKEMKEYVRNLNDKK
jgi:hypothetical protein